MALQVSRSAGLYNLTGCHAYKCKILWNRQVADVSSGCLRGLNLNPTLKMIDKLGGAKKKGEKFIKLEEVSPWRLGQLLYLVSAKSLDI